MKLAEMQPRLIYPLLILIGGLLLPHAFIIPAKKTGIYVTSHVANIEECYNVISKEALTKTLDLWD